MLYFKALVVQWKDIRPWRPELGPEGSFSFWKKYIYIFWPMNMEQRSFDGLGARSAPFGILMSPKRRVRSGAHARQKPTSYRIVIQLSITSFQ